MRERVLRRLAGPAGPIWIAAIALMLALPSATMEPVLDDHGFRRRLWVEQRGPNAAFDFAPPEPGWHGRRGPWWFDAGAERRFLRPLSGVTHWLDFRLWPDAAWWMRVENCLIYCLLAALAAYGYVRFCGTGWAAAVAGLMFAVDDAHAQSLSMITGRNTLLSAVFGLGALLAHHAEATAPNRTRRWLAPLLFASSLLASEGGLAMLAYFVAHAICFDQRPAGARTRSLLPHGGVAAVWGVAYALGGYGSGDGRFYRDPVADPWGTLGSGLLDLPVWIASQLTLGLATPTLELNPAAVRLACLAIALLMAWLLRPALRERPAARFFALGFVLSIVPLMLTLPQDRLLVMASFGAFGLLGCFIASPSSRRTRAVRSARLALLAIHLGLAPLAFMPSYLLAGRFARAEAKVQSELMRPMRTAATGIVIVRAPVIGTLAYGLSKQASLGLPLPRYSYELYAAASALEILRIDARTLELAPRGGYCQSRAECIGTQSPTAFRIGQTIEMSDMRVEIRELTQRGSPRRVRFSFASNLEDPARRWLIWTREGLRPFAVPALHETRSLPPLSPIDAFR